MIKWETCNMTFCTLETCGGHALHETENWYSDNSRFVDSGRPWFAHGSNYNTDRNADVFNVISLNGVISYDIGS